MHKYHNYTVHDILFPLRVRIISLLLVLFWVMIKYSRMFHFLKPNVPKIFDKEQKMFQESLICYTWTGSLDQPVSLCYRSEVSQEQLYRWYSTKQDHFIFTKYCTYHNYMVEVTGDFNHRRYSTSWIWNDPHLYLWFNCRLLFHSETQGFWSNLKVSHCTLNWHCEKGKVALHQKLSQSYMWGDWLPYTLNSHYSYTRLTVRLHGQSHCSTSYLVQSCLRRSNVAIIGQWVLREYALFGDSFIRCRGWSRSGKAHHPRLEVLLWSPQSPLPIPTPLSSI